MYDKESLQELEERIRALEPDCNSEEWLALMDAYTARTSGTLPDVDSSFQSFLRDYSGTPPLFAEEAEAPAPKKARRHVPVKLLRTALIAAALAALFSVTAYALGWFGLRERAVHTGYETSLAVIEEDGSSHLESAEAVILLPTGYRDSPEYQAAAEWFSFQLQYQEERSRASVAAGGGAWDWCDDAGVQALLGSNIYLASDVPMAEKLLEIRDRYGLRLHSSMVFPPTEAEFYRLTGTAPFFLGEGWVSPGYVFEDGAYKSEGSLLLEGRECIWSLSRYVPGTIPAYLTLIRNEEDFEEWSYTTAGGDTVVIDYARVGQNLSLNPESEDLYHAVLIHYTGKDAFLNLSSQVPGGREQAEKLAEAFAFAAACNGTPEENFLLEKRVYAGEQPALTLSAFAERPEAKASRTFLDWYISWKGSPMARDGCPVGCTEEAEPALREAYEKIAAETGLRCPGDWCWIHNGYVYPRGYNGGVRDFDAYTEKLSSEQVWQRLGLTPFDAIEPQDLLLYDTGFALDSPYYRLRCWEKGSFFANLRLPSAGEGREEWLFETRCGAVVSLSLPGEDPYDIAAILYEAPEHYVLIVPNHPDLYSLQAIAWNIDFTRFR